MQSLLVLLAVGALSVLASSRSLLEAGRFFGLAQLSASGLLFLVCGVLLGPGVLGLFGEADLGKLRPLVALGLGLGGLMMGINLDLRVLRRLPRAVYRASLAQSGLSFLVVSVPLAFVLLASTGMATAQGLGAAALLGASASVSSGHLAVLWARWGRLDRGRGLSVALLTMMDDLVGVLVLAVALAIGAAASPWAGLGLVGLAVGVGVACGALVAFLAHGISERAELVALLLGGLALVSGAAAYLRLSALISGLFCGAVLALVGGRSVEAIFRILTRVERPAYLALLFLIGAHVDPQSLVTWAVLPAYVALRFIGKVVGGGVAQREMGAVLQMPHRLGYALIAQGGVALCVVTEYLVLVPGAGSQLVFSVAAFAALVNEALASRVFGLSLRAPAVPDPATGAGL